MIRIPCRCGEVLHADAQHAGRQVRCRCGRTHTVRLPRPTRPSLRSRIRAFGAGLSRHRHPASLRRAGRRRTPTRLASRYPVAARWTAYAAVTYLALTILAAAVVWGLGDRTWIGTVVLFSGRWLLLLPLLPLLVAAVLLHRGALLPLALAALVALFPVMGLRTGWRALLPHGDAYAERLRLVAFNMAGKLETVPALLALMEQHDVDVALLQECPLRTAPAAMGFWNVLGDADLCVLSRHPVRVLDRMNIAELMPRDDTYGGTSMATRYELSLAGGTVTLVNVHLETARRGLRGVFEGDVGRIFNNMVLRRVESRATAQYIGDERDALIVAGDFNLPVESAIYRAFWGGWHNAFSRAGHGFGFTRDNGWIRVRIDHVLSGRDWQPRRAWAGPAIGSDHRPIFAELMRNRPLREAQH